MEAKFEGRVLFLSQDAAVMRRQVAGEDLALADALPLRDNISTDEITPPWTRSCFDDKLGDCPYLGLKCGDETPVDAGSVRRGGFAVAVAGRCYGKGSSSEASPYAEKLAGIRLVIAESFERSYRQNCHKLGLLTSTDVGLVERIRNGEAIPVAEFTRGEDPLAAEIIRHGGLFAFTRARLAGGMPTAAAADARPMTYAEKILARARAGRRGPVRPGDALFARADWRYAQDHVSPMAIRLLEREMGPDVKLRDPKSIVSFAERHAEPGQLVVGTDPHTPHCGALGALALGVGASDMACAWVTGDVRVTVPPSCRVRLHGEFPPGVEVKDVVLHLLRLPYLRDGHAVGQVIEYSGEAMLALSTDERARLTDMAVDIGGFCGIVAPDAETLSYLRERRGLAMALDPWMRSDPDAEFAHTIEVDCSALEPMRAETPGQHVLASGPGKWTAQTGASIPADGLLHFDTQSSIP